jgi:pimeloyl-ACP methyl ester carboxylesterase
MKKLLKTLFGILTGYIIGQQLWVLWNILKSDPNQTLRERANKATDETTLKETKRRKAYTIQHVIENGIERISYLPTERKHKTPLLFQHGMFHSAWCWHLWQERLAELGWENHAISLPGHGNSPTQRSIQLCTLDYYLNFLRDEVRRYERKPVLIGHSMGGALAQWYLKYIGDNLPAVVLVAPWVSHNALADGMPMILRLDPALLGLVMLSWDSSPWIRTPEHTGRLFLSPRAVISPVELHAHLGPESGLVAYQHIPPFWSPAENIQTPILVLAGEQDAVVSVPGLRRTALHYKADFALVEGAGHNLMMEHNWDETAEMVNVWLTEQGIE